VLTTAKVVVFFLAGVTSEACLCNIFGRLILEADYFCRVAFFRVGFAWTMARFTPGDLSFPTADFG
jgi:hypothetical protein